MVVIKKNK